MLWFIHFVVFLNLLSNLMFQWFSPICSRIFSFKWPFLTCDPSTISFCRIEREIHPFLKLFLSIFISLFLSTICWKWHPTEYLGTSFWNPLIIANEGPSTGHPSLFHWTPQIYCHNVGWELSFAIGSDSPTLFFIFTIGSFYCHGNVIWFVNSIKNSARILIGIVQKLYLDQFGKT